MLVGQAQEIVLDEAPDGYVTRPDLGPEDISATVALGAAPASIHPGRRERFDDFTEVLSAALLLVLALSSQLLPEPASTIVTTVAAVAAVALLYRSGLSPDRR